MNAEEYELAERFRTAIIEFDRERPRSKQSSDFIVGMSELGFCSERTRRMLAGVTPEPTYSLDAFIGTAIGDHVEQAFCAAFPDTIRQAEVVTRLEGDSRTYTLPGHPDLIVPSEGLVIDGKTTHGLDIARRNGPSRQQQYQRHGYALGAWACGYFPLDYPLEEVRVANVWFDRSGDDTEPHVHIEPYSPTVMAEAAQWLDEVVYLYLNGGEAPKEPPRNVCEAICGHYATCRMLDTTVEGLIDDPDQLTAMVLYQEGLSLEREGRSMKDQAKSVLRGVEGSNGEWIIRWVHVNESIVPESKRRAHDKITFSKLK